jgi:hypothetical protein
MTKTNPEPKLETLAETENYIALQSDDPDGETTYLLELNNVTIHFFREEWEEFIQLVRQLKG